MDARTKEILTALLESDTDDESSVKDFLGVPPEILDRQKKELLPVAIEHKSKYLGYPCVQVYEPHTNPQGETYIFGRFGKREPSTTMSTLLYLNPDRGWQIVESEEDGEDFKEVYGGEEPTAYLPLGTVIHRTMREEDLIPAFLDALESVAPRQAAEMREEYADQIAQADPEFCWEVLVDALDAHAPPYTYFGSNPGDGSDMGVWISDETITDDLHYEDADKLQAMRRGERMPQGSQYVIVTDQGGNYEELLDGLSGQQIWAV